MNTLTNARRGFLSALLLIIPCMLKAQADVNINVTKSSSTWYTNPIVWVIGAAVFILLIVAIARGGGK